MAEETNKDPVITELTEEQKAKFPYYVDKWVNIGLSCEPCDFEASKKWAVEAYKAADVKPPRFFFLADSPWHGMAMAYVLNKLVVEGKFEGKSQDELTKIVEKESRELLPKIEELPNIASYLEDQIYGSHDASWLCFYDFFLEEFDLDCVKPLRPLIELSKVCGWWTPYEDFAIFQHRHTELHLDDQGRLHNEDGMAVAYKDGFGVWAIGGVRVNEQIIMRPETLEVEQMLKQENAEVKRIMIDRYGWENFLEKIGAEELDKGFDQDGIALYLLKADAGGEEIRGLASACTTTGRQYFMEVSTNCKTIAEAQEYLQGGKKFNIIEQS